MWLANHNLYGAAKCPQGTRARSPTLPESRGPGFGSGSYINLVGRECSLSLAPFGERYERR